MKGSTLHVVDPDAHLSSDTIYERETVESIWDVFLSFWASLHIGFPQMMCINQGSAFKTLRWSRKCENRRDSYPGIWRSVSQLTRVW